ncbi:762_t:CDS:2 [Entrophospora sp. SA101]|nr:762_t:CDS:2 [Entrophospora sp. SA101]
MVKNINNAVTDTNKINKNKNKKTRGPYVSRACNNCKKTHRKCSEGNGSCKNCLRKNWICSKDIFIVQSNDGIVDKGEKLISTKFTPIHQFYSYYQAYQNNIDYLDNYHYNDTASSHDNKY